VELGDRSHSRAIEDAMSEHTRSEATTGSPEPGADLTDDEGRRAPHIRVAALALGLSYAGLTTDEHVAALADSRDLQILRGARDHLDHASHLPPKVTTEAEDLLDRAIRHTTSDQSQ
jgi:hypothetical protein